MMRAKASKVCTGYWHVGDHPRRRNHAALLRPDGRVEATFGIGDTLEDIGALLQRAGLVLHPDNTVTRANGEAMP